MHRPKKQDAERGQALIEFALTVPILLMLVFGIIDLARLVFAYTQVIDAARQGVRYGIVEGLEKGNYQYLDCDGITNAALDTPGLVPSDDLTVTITYMNLQDNAVQLGKCTGSTPPASNLLKDGAVLAVKVDGSITPITPILAMFDNNISFDYTAKRAIAESAAFTDKWPTAPPVPKNFRSQQNCTEGRVYFFWDPLTIWPDEIQIKDSFTNAIVQTIYYPETQYAYCKDDDPYEGRVCGADIDPNNGYGMWYMVVIQDGLEGTSSLDATASCSGGGGGGGTGGGTVSFSGVVFDDVNSNCKQGPKEAGLGGFTVKVWGAGTDGTLFTADDDLQHSTTTASDGTYHLIGDIPEGETYWHFWVEVTAPATYHMSCDSTKSFSNMVDSGTGTANFGAYK